MQQPTARDGRRLDPSPDIPPPTRNNCQHDILSVVSKYGINRLDNSVFSIKKSMWQTFAATVV